MEAISLKLDENMLKNIDKSLAKHNFSTRTEFIRDAIREKLDDLEKTRLIKMIRDNMGKAPKKTTDAERRRVREEVFKEFEEKLKRSPQA